MHMLEQDERFRLTKLIEEVDEMLVARYPDINSNKRISVMEVIVVAALNTMKPEKSNDD